MDNAEPMRFNVADIQTQMTLGGGVLKGGILVVDPNGLLVAYGHYARLKAEVERLRKAGDAMAKRTEFFQKRWDADELCQEVEAWNAAKEGNPSV